MKEKFPETEFVSVTEGPENPADLWINITALEDENREEELISFASDQWFGQFFKSSLYILFSSLIQESVRQATNFVD